MRYYYDFHIHSCLSPCADNDMTPNNISGMLKLAGIKVAALTDHNSLKNCPAFFEAAERNGIIPIAGVEITTLEDIHVVCLFRRLSAAMEFDVELYRHRVLIKNKTEVFGDQLILDGKDATVSTEPYFLTNATDLSVDDIPLLVKNFNGISYPAHVDREANGIIAILGDFPEKPAFDCVEFRSFENKEKYIKAYDKLVGKKVLYGSDSHFLCGIKDAANAFEFEVEERDPLVVTDKIFDFIAGDCEGTVL